MRFDCDWSSDVCSSDLIKLTIAMTDVACHCESPEYNNEGVKQSGSCQLTDPTMSNPSAENRKMSPPSPSKVLQFALLQSGDLPGRFACHQLLTPAIDWLFVDNQLCVVPNDPNLWPIDPDCQQYFATYSPHPVCFLYALFRNCVSTILFCHFVSFFLKSIPTDKDYPLDNAFFDNAHGLAARPPLQHKHIDQRQVAIRLSVHACLPWKSKLKWNNPYYLQFVSGQIL